jgi:membrane fusion protein, adhesin transport system
MLDISNNSIQHNEDMSSLTSLKKVQVGGWHIGFRNLLLILLGTFFFFMFLPWTQNVNADGKLTTLRPEQRPQTIHATISGRVEAWYVTEGQQVSKGDTIVYISEVKSDYFDPQLVERVGNQVNAKEGAIQSYQGKADALGQQMGAMRREMRNKIDQIENKIEQKALKVISDSIAILQAENDVKIAKRQLDGMKAMYDKGLESLTKLEERRLKLVDVETKLVKATNELEISRNELNNAKIENYLTRNEFANKLAKTESERFSTISDKYDAQGSVQKLKVERTSYAIRAGFYYITAPQDGYIIKAITPGIGEIVKEGAPIVSIMPANAELAVEMYVKPIDVPLIENGRLVRFMFDGWPAFFFSGWPGLSLGTYAGHVVAIDRNISPNGKFRVLIAAAKNDAPWPTALRVGGGAKGIAMLNDVPIWYEIWRMLNGFPPDMYKPEEEAQTKK